ncbi:tachykinins isoform X1 [Copidosoma floridanum]|uniref:tachykinins isoform X1 n=1 Tax=Copidosoma floridanum TaxID=29053 RepID=UPI0006C9AF95|nr:tachykinins isoform X1 [Copidosoma floridanum]
MAREGNVSSRAFAIAMMGLLVVLITSVRAQHETPSSAGHRGNDVGASEFSDAETKKRPAQDLSDLEKYHQMQELRDAGNLMRQLRELDEVLLGPSDYEKRASMRGFQGMRGKKSNEPYDGGARGYYYLDESMLDKRAPYSAFQGVRGKKSLEEVMMGEAEKRARMAGFQGMRGKKSEDFEDSDVEWHEKRAPSHGFQGMRGKKGMTLRDLYDDELVKRALSSFHGMRGKKDMTYEPPNDFDNYVDKRPMMMSFHGMRGKRSLPTKPEDAAGGGGSYKLEKRSPYRFFGSRGKKNPRWDSRAIKGFVGVRGKRLEQPKQLVSTWPSSADVYDELELAAVAAAAAEHNARSHLPRAD